MRVIKLFILSAIAFSIVLTCISFLIPSRIRIFKSIELNAPADRIFSFIKDTSKWQQWHPGFLSPDTLNDESHLKTHLQIIESSDSTVIIKIYNNRTSIFNTWQLLHFNDSHSSVLQWHMDFNLKWYPWEKFRSFFFEKTHGVMMEEGLANLKKLSE